MAVKLRVKSQPYISNENHIDIRTPRKVTILSVLGVGLYGIVVFVVAIYPETETGALIGLITIFICAIIAFPVRHYTSYWKINSIGFESRILLNRRFIARSDVKRIDSSKGNVNASLIVYGNGKKIVIPLYYGKGLEVCDLIMKVYPESVWIQSEFILMGKAELDRKSFYQKQ